MRIVIIEDEDLAAESLEKMLLSAGYDLTIKKRLESVAQAVAWFKENTCDLIFSDIHLGDGESFEIFEALDIQTPIVFTTAFDHYAIKSFQFYAIDYLLKPYDKEKLKNAIEKYINFRGVSDKDYESLHSLINKLKEVPGAVSEQQRFLVYKGDELVSIKSEEVAYFMADNKLLFLFTTNGGVYLYEDTISSLEPKLSKKDFFKINRKFIVRHNAIKSIVRYSQNRLRVHLQPVPTDTDTILISSRNIGAFKDWLNN